ncbi:MAG: hypothetical protein K8H89_03960 [Flavobacteriales bacterium]|jgi:hypothetical protein|nr:hypothetical protein [Flavobacteriales bacterium]
MTFTSQLDEMLIALRQTQARLLAPLDHQQLLLPTDPEVFVEDVLYYVMDEWKEDLRKEGHVLDEITSWNDPVSHYPRYELRIRGGAVVDLLFTGTYPKSLHLHLSKGMASKTQFSDAQAVQVPLLVSNDPNALLFSIIGGLKDFIKK